VELVILPPLWLRRGRARQCERQKSPLVLSPEEVILGLAQLEFRDQILVFPDGALGIRQGELGALHWLDCDFNNMNFSVQHSYYWRRGGHLKRTKTEASAKLLPMHPSLKLALLEWRSLSLYNQPGDFVSPSERLKGKKPLDLASVLKKKIQPAFKRIGITGVGWHTFRHTVGTMLAEMGEHQLMICDYLRHSDLHVTNKYLQATTKSKRLAQGKLVDAILPGGRAVGKQINLDPLAREVRFFGLFGWGETANRQMGNACWTQTDPDRFSGSFVNHSKEWRGRRDSNPRPLP
jgi:integrase